MSARQSFARSNARRELERSSRPIRFLPRRQPPTNALPFSPANYGLKTNMVAGHLAGQRCREFQPPTCPAREHAPSNSNVGSTPLMPRRAAVPPAPRREFVAIARSRGAGLSGLLLRPPGHELRSPFDIWWARLLRAVHLPWPSNAPSAARAPATMYLLSQRKKHERANT
jgi:hypothetical protein